MAAAAAVLEGQAAGKLKAAAAVASEAPVVDN